MRSVGDCQIQARVGLRLGPSLTRRSMECQGRPGLLLLPIAVFRCGEHLPGGRGLLGLFWTATCPSERGEREPLPPRAVHGSSGSRWSSWCGPPAESLRVRPFPRFLAHSQPPCGRWYQEGVAGQRACFKKVGPADAPCSGGAKPSGRAVRRWSKPLARRLQRAVEPLGGVVGGARDARDRSRAARGRYHLAPAREGGHRP